jgi:hypothetical protein
MTRAFVIAKSFGAFCLLAVLVAAVNSAAGSPVNETEPNETAATATLLNAGESGVGDVTVGDVDFWSLAGASIGDLIFAFVDTSDAGGDSLLRALADDTTTQIAEDDNSGPLSSSVIAGAPVPQAGNVFLRVSESGDDQIIGLYTLYQAIVDPTESMTEAEPNDTREQAHCITRPLVKGTMGASDRDVFRFQASEDDFIVVILDKNPNGDMSFTDAKIEITDSNGTVLDNGTGDNDASGQDNAAGTAIAPATGTYFVSLARGPSGDSDYQFIVLINETPFFETDGDTDNDGTVDCQDNCPNTPNADQADADGDGVGDACDNCPSVSNFDQANSDGDTAGDACDGCPIDPQKIAPGLCPCGVADTDTDTDGTPDCNDGCPSDANKTAPGACGCGAAEASPCVPPPETGCGACGAGSQAVMMMAAPVLIVSMTRRRARSRRARATSPNACA